MNKLWLKICVAGILILSAAIILKVVWPAQSGPMSQTISAEKTQASDKGQPRSNQQAEKVQRFNKFDRFNIRKMPQFYRRPSEFAKMSRYSENFYPRRLNPLQIRRENNVSSKEELIRLTRNLKWFDRDFG